MSFFPLNSIFSPLRTQTSSPNPVKPLQTSHHEALTALEATSQLLPVKSKTGIINHQEPEEQQRKQQNLSSQVYGLVQNSCIFRHLPWFCHVNEWVLISLPYFRTAIHQIIVILKAFQVRTVWKMQITSVKEKMPIPVCPLHLTHRSPEPAQHLSLKLLFLVITCPIQENSSAISRKTKRPWRKWT